MEVSYYELHCEVVIIEEFSMRCEIQQHIDDSE